MRDEKMGKSPKGCSNVGGMAAAKTEFCRKRALDLFASYGYRNFSAAGLQLIDDVWRKLSGSRSKNLIAVTSPHGEPCVLRADLTLSAVAYLDSHYRESERPLRLSYSDRVFAAPSPPSDSIEQYQVGIELLGWEGEGSEAEVLTVLFRTLDALSISDSVVVLGDTSVTASFFEGLPEGDALKLIDALQSKSLTCYSAALAEADLPAERRKVLESLPYLKGDCDVIGEAMKIMRDASVIMPLKHLCDTLSSLGFSERLRVDLGFIRDLGYYNGPVFDVYSPVSGALLGGGGRYGGLLARMGVEGEAAGFALNLKELAAHSSGEIASPEIMIWCGNAAPAELLRYADCLEKKGVSFELSWRKDRESSLATASRRGFRYWVNFSDKSVVSVSGGDIEDLKNFERNVLPC
jgi:ATP phosphoribosyltransferase regulatory subunit